MADDRKVRQEKAGGDPEREPGPREWVPLQEGRYGASWFVMMSGLLMVAYFFYSLFVENIVVIQTVTEPPTYGGPTEWATIMAPWLLSNAYVVILGSLFFLAGYSLTLKRKGGVPRGVLLLRLFGICAGFVTVAMLVMGLWYTFFLPKELSGFAQNLEFYGLQFVSFLVWGTIMAGVAAYCFLPGKDAGRDQGV